MLGTEIIRLALASLATNKLRSSLTMVGIAVGVFSVIGVMTVISGLRSSIESGLNVLGANSFQIQKFPAINFSNPWVRFRNRRDISYTQGERFKELMRGTAEVSISLRRGGRRVGYLDRKTNPNIGLIGGDENSVTSRNYEIAAGRNIGADDVEFGRAVVVLGDDIVKRLFSGEEAVGRIVRIDGQNYTVIGLLESKGSAFGGTQDNLAITPITQFLEIYGNNSWRSVSITVQAVSQAVLAETQDTAIGYMRLARGLAPEQANDFEVFSNDSLIESFSNVAGVVAIGAFVISAIALLAAGVGVMNIMLVSVTERTKEIGIRKSIGAKKRNILTQFLIEAVVLSLLGGLAGVLFGVVGGNLGAKMLNAETVFPWMWAVIGLLVCSAIGIGFGFYPAWKAASLDPIEALRYE
jgi:putative ABC transport system permease protein